MSPRATPSSNPGLPPGCQERPRVLIVESRNAVLAQRQGQYPFLRGSFVRNYDHGQNVSSNSKSFTTSVCSYLYSVEEALAQLFIPLNALEERARHFALRPISGEQGLETYERITVEDHVRCIIAELYKVPAARDNLGLAMASGLIIIPMPEPKTKSKWMQLIQLMSPEARSIWHPPSRRQHQYHLPYG